MSTPTPKPLKIKRDGIHSNTLTVWLDAPDGTAIKITGPSRERIAKQILAMDKAVEALKWYVEEDRCRCGPMEGGSNLYCRHCKARETLKSIEA